MDLIKQVGALSITSAPVKSGYLWLGWSVIGGLLPLWGTAGLLFLFDRPISLFDFLKHGEFVLYSASFIGGGMYCLRKDVFPSRNVLNFLFFAALATSLLVFIAISITSLGNKPEWLTVSKDALASISIWVFIISTFLCFLVTVADAGNLGRDIPDELRKDGVALENAFDKLLKNKGPR